MTSGFGGFRTIRIKWTRFVQSLPDWMFAPAPAPIDHRSMGENQDKPASDEDINQRKKNHHEISKTIGRLFYTLVGTCLFCVITLMSSGQNIDFEAQVKLPILSYDVNFYSFLVVGPIIITGLTIYLHIFVEEYRRYSASPDVNYTMLHDFDSWAPRLAVLAIFYWMAPITLAAFVWNRRSAETELIDLFLIILTSLVTLGLILLQFRRCPRKLRPRAFPWLFLVGAGFMAAFVSIANPQNSPSRPSQDLARASATNDGVKQVIAQAELEQKNFAGDRFPTGFEEFREKNFRGANFDRAVMREADLRNTSFREATLVGADLSGSDLGDANLRYANLTGTILRDANLSNADFFGATMHGTDISGVDLSGVKIDSYQLDQVCGDDVEPIANRFSIKTCER